MRSGKAAVARVREQRKKIFILPPRRVFASSVLFCRDHFFLFLRSFLREARGVDALRYR